MDFCQQYESHFIHRGMNGVDHARHYLSGLLGKQRRKNIETIFNDVSSSDYQGMEQFISSSPWCHQSLMRHIAQDASSMMAEPEQTGLFIDESSFLKKGKASVGVQRQWSGRAGKVENCQVAVFASLADGKRMALTDYRLFLPESWADDPTRCDKAKIPDSERNYRPKWQLALDMVKNARANGLSFGWVGVDCLYGSTAEFLLSLEDLGEHFVADISKTTKVWTSAPLLEEPTPKKTKGRPATRTRLHPDNTASYRSVKDIADEFFEKQHQTVSYRQGTKGKLSTRVMTMTVWAWEKGWSTARQRRLIIRRDADNSYKWTLTNLPDPKDPSKDAWHQGQRFWVEHAFHEAKSQLGMAQYQVRVWRGWHHHMAMVCLALLFTEKVKDITRAGSPLLSARDITELLDYYLPRKNRNEAEILAQIKARHKQRQEDIDRRAHELTGLPKQL